MIVRHYEHFSLVDAHRKDICLQTNAIVIFKFANYRNKRRFVSTAIEAVIGILMTIGDINDIFLYAASVGTYLLELTVTPYLHFKVNTGPSEETVRKVHYLFLTEEKAKVRKKNRADLDIYYQESYPDIIFRKKDSSFRLTRHV